MLSTIGAWLAWLGVQPTHLVAGFVGGIIRALVNKNGSIWQRLAEGTVGTLFAVFLTPFLIVLLGVTAPQIGAAIAVILGMVGMSIASAVIDIGKDYAANPGKLKDDFFTFLQKFVSKSDDK